MMRILLLAALLAASGTAFAHEHVKVGDDRYELTVGWKNEPPYVGIPNGLDLKVVRLAADEDHEEGDDHDDANATHGHDEDPEVVLGADANLTVTYEYGGKTFSPVDFR